MVSHRISFATVFDLGENVFSTVVDEGTLIDLDHVDEYHSFLASVTEGKSFAMLVHRLYPYGYSDSAKKEITRIPNLCAVGLVVYDEESMNISSEMMELCRSSSLEFDIFTDENCAEDWLRQLVSV